MQRSSLWDAAVRSSGTMITLGTVMYAGAPVDGFADLRIVGGSVTQDATAAVRGRCDVQLAEPTRLPLGAGDPLAPYGFELVVERGVIYRQARPARSRAVVKAIVTDDGSVLVTDSGEVLGFPLTRYYAGADAVVEMKRLGVFPIQRSTVDGTRLTTSIAALDRAQRVKDARIMDAWPIASGTPFHEAIANLIDAGVPGLEYAFAHTPFTTPTLTIPADSDRWEAAVKLAKSIGMELFFDGYGRCVLRPKLDVRSAGHVWEVAEASTMIDLQVELDRSDAFNQWKVVGTNSASDDAYTATATDLDPSSPSYFYGPFGQKPAPILRSPLIGSTEQAQAAANGNLIAGIGVGRVVSAAGLANPALEAGDPILFHRPKIGVSEVHLAEVITTGLGPTDPQTYSARARQVAA